MNAKGGMQVINTFGAELIKPSLYSTYPKPDDHEISSHIAALQVNEAANVTVSDAFAPKSLLQRKRVNENHSASYQLSTINDDINIIHKKITRLVIFSMSIYKLNNNI
jgi:hypothetical protein